MGSRDYFHVQGPKRELAFQHRADFVATSCQSFAKEIVIGETTLSLSFLELYTKLAAVAIANDNPEFNCQHWIDAALMTLHDAGYLTAEQHALGVDGMVDAVMESKDDVISVL